MAEHLPTESKPGLTICQVKEEEVLVDGLSMFRENSNGKIVQWPNVKNLLVAYQIKMNMHIFLTIKIDTS
jgi:hypothetical protein